MLKKLRLVACLGALVALGACTTPLGQQYGVVGGVGGAAIGGAAGGLPGAVIGGAAGALAGGLIGDQQSQQYYGPVYRPYRGCYIVRVPVYDGWHRFIGYRDVCR